MYNIKVKTEGVNEESKITLLFAAEELQKYLSMVLGDNITVSESDGEHTIVLGIGLRDSVKNMPTESDDAIEIDIKDMSGIITGSNARSVLIGCYRFLRETGFCFIKPGKNGEKIPSTLSKRTVYITEKPAYRHRGVVIEGSLYRECLSEFIDWLPKVGLNSYFIQFRTVEFFVNRFYRYPSSYRETQELSEKELEEIIRGAENEIKKRGLIYHAVGHGWTCDVMGVDGNDWYEYEGEMPEKAKKVAAVINGKRIFFKNMPLDTNLCYSNADVRDEMTENIANYCENHSEIDYLHFWLADARNNNCECSECVKKLPSDYYVQMLNELDEKLAKRNLKTKIVFLMYVDLLWIPLYERFKNSERFVLMFAPITRSFTKSISSDVSGKTTPFVRNKLEFPQNVEDNVEYLRQWQSLFDGDSFDYDYHFWYDQFLEFSWQKLSKVLYEDIKNLRSLGLNGMLAAGTNRSFMPTALGMNTLAETLWNTNVDFEEIRKRIFSAEFGDNYPVAEEYLTKLSEINCAEALRCEEPLFTPENTQKLEKGIAFAEEFEKKAEKIAESVKNGAEKHSWKALTFHAGLYKKLFVLYLNARGEEAESLKADVIDFVLKNEEEFKTDFDSVVFCERISFTLSRIIGAEGKWMQ